MRSSKSVLITSGILVIIFSRLLIISFKIPNFPHWSGWAACLSGALGVFGAEVIKLRER